MTSEPYWWDGLRGATHWSPGQTAYVWSCCNETSQIAPSAPPSKEVKEILALIPQISDCWEGPPIAPLRVRVIKGLGPDPVSNVLAAEWLESQGCRLPDYVRFAIGLSDGQPGSKGNIKHSGLKQAGGAESPPESGERAHPAPCATAGENGKGDIKYLRPQLEPLLKETMHVLAGEELPDGVKWTRAIDLLAQAATLLLDTGYKIHAQYETVRAGVVKFEFGSDDPFLSPGKFGAHNVNAFLLGRLDSTTEAEKSSYRMQHAALDLCELYLRYLEAPLPSVVRAPIPRTTKVLAPLPNLHEYATRKYWGVDEATWVLICGVNPSIEGDNRHMIRLLPAPILREFVDAWTAGEIANKGTEERPVFTAEEVLTWAESYPGFERPTELRQTAENATANEQMTVDLKLQDLPRVVSQNPNAAKTAPVVKLEQGTRWNRIRLKLVTCADGVREVDGLTVFAHGKQVMRITFSELGMADKRTLKPNAQWQLIESLAAGSGVLPKKTNARTRQRLSNTLSQAFGIEETAFGKEGRNWIAKFSIEPQSRM